MRRRVRRCRGSRVRGVGPDHVPIQTRTLGPLNPCTLLLPAPLRAQRIRSSPIDREIKRLERPGQDEAVVAAGSFDGDILVEHVVEDPLGITRQRIAPASAAAITIGVALTRLVMDVKGGGLDLVLVRAADAETELVRRAG